MLTNMTILSYLETEESLLPGLASSPYKEGTLSLGAAAKLEINGL
jgi:hypothetical protein